jgi:glyoxylase-like metal-dependent hydrolase (beta-lactamase superfamily II)
VPSGRAAIMVPSLPVMTELMVHTYTAAEPGIFVNSYLLETADGVVLVDAGLLVSDARALAARVAALRKPLMAAFVTHPHPDHFNGLPYVVSDDVPVYATSAASKTIEETAVAKREQWQPTYGPEWPDRFRVPDRPLDGGGAVEAAGLRIQYRETVRRLAATPLLIVHGNTDAYCSPELARALYERKPGEKEILWLDASQHIDLYDQEPYVTQAAQAASSFLHRKLAP